MLNDLGDFCLLPRPDLPPDTLKEVDSKSPKSKPPTLVSDTVLPENLTCERREWLWGITHETPGGVGVQGKDENESKVVGVPKRFEALLADLVVSCGIH